MFEWEEGDRYSFEDSERFEEESECSWLSEPESLCNNWRGWKKQLNNNLNTSYTPNVLEITKDEVEIKSLAELCARSVAAHIPFEVVEQMMPVIPEQIQLWIAFWSFPDNEEDIRLYSCLANGNADEFVKGENLYKHNCVEDVLQIGFHLSASVVVAGGSKDKFKVAVSFDRGRISSCNCTCGSIASWCGHIVAVCLNRIHGQNNLKLRAPVSESLSQLQRDQLQKFAQYLISELPQQILPTAQRLIDEILSNSHSSINSVPGAPDPTAGACANEQTAWWLDESNLHSNIRKILIKFCVPSPMVFSDVNYLSTTAPPVATEWQSLLRPLRGREPEGMWNLLSIVREMFKRQDHNAVPLLEVITKECISTEKVLVWWVNTKLALHLGSGHGTKGGINSNCHGAQYACSSLCDEIVILWRLAALNPALSPQERETLMQQFKDWHLEVQDKVGRSKEFLGNGNNKSRKNNFDLEAFSGFRPAIEACLLDWNDYVISGVTYCPGSFRYFCPVLCRKQDFCHISPVTSTSTSHNNQNHHALKRNPQRMAPIKNSTWANVDMKNVFNRSASQRSSSGSSEGFCDNDGMRDFDGSSQDQPSSSGECAYSYCQNDLKNTLANLSQGRGSSRSAAGNVVNNLLRSNEDKLNKQKFSFSVDNENSNEDEAFDKDLNNDVPGCNPYLYNPNLSESSDRSSVTDRANNHDPQQQSQLYTENQSPSDLFSDLKKLEDSMEILFARAEALHAHGHTKEASRLAVLLAEKILASSPNLSLDIYTPLPKSKKRREKMNPVCHHLTRLASATLSKCAFLCSVLAEDFVNVHLAFQVALFGLEMRRPPASTKPLEVKLANQESDLVNLLKKLTLGTKEMSIIREKAESMRSGLYKARGESLLPLMLAAFVFDALVVSNSYNTPGVETYHRSTDETLGFEGAVAALAMKSNVSEAEHPLLCEGTRRQRGELALTLLLHYKDDNEKLALIMDNLLDKEIHPMYKSQPLSAYYSTKVNSLQGMAYNTDNINVEHSQTRPVSNLAASSSGKSSSAVAPNIAYTNCSTSNNSESLEQSVSQLSISATVGGTRPKTCTHKSTAVYNSEEGESSNNFYSNCDNCSREFAISDELKTWEDDINRWREDINMLQKKKSKTDSKQTAEHKRKTTQNLSSNSGGTIPNYSKFSPSTRNSNQNEVKSDETPVDKTQGDENRASSSWNKIGPGSDSGSSGNSSDSVISGSSFEKGNSSETNKPIESPPLCYPVMRPVVSSTMTTADSPTVNTRPQQQNAKPVRYKGKRIYPSIPNQPSEATAYFMFELAKTVLSKAGGNSSTSLFKQPPINQQNHRGPQRALQMCAFQIGLYALGLSNCVSPNWLSRTYSSHVSWISNQTMEIGAPALSFLIDTWDGHLTPQEAASIADKASRGRDANTIRQAARLALSCLPHAHALNPNEIQRAIIQCKELSSKMLEEACLAVEVAAKEGGVYPEVLFMVARCWYEIFETRNQHSKFPGKRDPLKQLDTHLVHEDAQQLPIQATVSIGKELEASGVAPPYSPSSLSRPVSAVSAEVSPSLNSVVSNSLNSVKIPCNGGPNLPPPYNLSNPQPHPMGFGLPSASPYIGYNYISNLSPNVGLQSLSPNVSCINQIPFQMYIQPSGLPITGTQGNMSQTIFTPPQPLQPLQYYPSLTISSTQGLSVISASQSVGGTGAGSAPDDAPPTIKGPATSSSGPLVQSYPPPSQGYFPLSFSGQIGPPGGFMGGSLNGQGQGPFSSGGLVSYIRATGPFCPTPPQFSKGHSGSKMQDNLSDSAVCVGQQPGRASQMSSDSASANYLLSAYRVGMLAMETLARRVQDDRPQAKYARNPPYGEDVKWLLTVAKKLGTQYLHQFCLCGVNSVISPFVLYDLAVDVVSYLSRNSPTLYQQHLRSPILQPLIQKCQQMFIQCTHMKMYYITPSDYEEFVSIIRSARLAFQMTAGGAVQFNELLQTLRRSKCCKKELWQRITSALQCPSV